MNERCPAYPTQALGYETFRRAQACAIRGLRTRVLERKKDPGDAPHTTGLLVKEVADEWDLPHALTRKIRGVRLYSPSLRFIDLQAPGYHFLATDTPALLRWLGMPLLVLGTVLGVVQAALGLNIMLNALRILGVIAAAPAAG